jgi:tripartite-type tricarboxylate transporter receptor subunit TctC
MNPVRCGLLLILAAALPGATSAQAQYPNKPLRFIMPYPPGGGTDTLGRILGQKLSEVLAQ